MQFPVDVYLKEEEEPIQTKVSYDTKLENFHFHFLKDELEAAPVEITDIDQELQKYIAKDLEKLQKEFGMYIFEEKLEATKARVTSYEKNGKEIVIQVELNDEYKTYCKIFIITKKVKQSIKSGDRYGRKCKKCIFDYTQISKTIPHAKSESKV